MPGAVSAVEPDTLVTVSERLVPAQTQTTASAVVASESPAVILEVDQPVSFPVEKGSGSQLSLETAPAAVQYQPEQADVAPASELDIAAEEQDHALVVAATSADYTADRQEAAPARETGSAETDGAGPALGTGMGEADAHSRMPYALVLALLALIGLVPVSRRSH